MNFLKIIEVFDGRLPEYQIINSNNEIVKSFDSFEEAEKWLENKNITPCGEENPCQ